ncbi:MAG: hypothetical protein H8E15_16720 [Planctomycetes bacterium]|nr:hypothetical protein [Planctomycetota bacterium]
MVELGGQTAAEKLTCAMTRASSWRCNMLGEKLERLDLESSTSIRLQLAPHEICSVIFDLPDAAKQARDLDARRKVWAQIHRQPSQ